MLFQPTNIIPDMRTGIGYGVVNLNQGLTVSWQVNGDYPVMTAFTINIYDNNTTSLLVYSTGKLTYNCPFQGRTPTGEPIIFSYTITSPVSVGLSNGYEYKLTIEQFYDVGGHEESVLQTSASVFVGRNTPTFSLIPPSSVTAETTFTFYYSQSQGDTVDWIRYKINAVSGGKSIPVFDSGNIYGPTTLECTYSGFVIGKTYNIQGTGQTSSGYQFASSVYTFNVEQGSGLKSLGGTMTAKCLNGFNAVSVDWSAVTMPADINPTDTWILFRHKAGDATMVPFGKFPITTTSVIDFGVGSGQGPVSYWLYAANSSGWTTVYTSVGLESGNTVSPTYYYWSILLCNTDGYGRYHVVKEFDFKNNLESGSVSNNNTPNVLQTFTQKPTVQLASSNYQSGTLTALIGKASMAQYTGDTLALRNALMALSTTDAPIFLKSSKGDVLMVKTSAPVSYTIMDTAKGQPQTITVPWVEIDNAQEVIIAYPSDAMFA